MDEWPLDRGPSEEPGKQNKKISKNTNTMRLSWKTYEANQVAMKRVSIQIGWEFEIGSEIKFESGEGSEFGASFRLRPWLDEGALHGCISQGLPVHLL